MESKYKNIIFDLGGVLVDLNPQHCYDAFKSIGIANVESLKHTDAGHRQLLQLETGRMTEEDFYAGVRQMTGSKASDEQICWAWNQFLERIAEEKKHKLLEIRRNHRVYLLSNTNVMHWNYSANHLLPLGNYGVDDYFDRVFLSYELHLSKPSPEIFKETLRLAGIKAEETLFIDDMKENCDAAQSLGINTWQNVHNNDWLDENELFE